MKVIYATFASHVLYSLIVRLVRSWNVHTSVQRSNSCISDFIYYMSNPYFIMTLHVMYVHAVCNKMLITFIPIYIFSSLSRDLIGHSIYKLLYIILNFLPSILSAAT